MADIMLSIGLMSGTSMDGIDAALLDTDGEGQIFELGNIKINYSAETRILLKAAERAVKNTGGDLARAAQLYLTALEDYIAQELYFGQGYPNVAALNKKVAHLESFLKQAVHSNEPLNFAKVVQHSTCLHADAVSELLKILGKQSSEIDVIGYHGQTLFHNPHERITVQIGDGKYLAQLTGITVVNDFRARDVLAGGQGAPFAPIYHQALAKRDKKSPLAVVNCGGIANISLIIDDNLEHLIGFDTGPGNGLIDALIKQRTAGIDVMDTDGKYGLHGKVSDEVLQALHAKSLQSRGDYLQRKPPKSLDIRDMQLIPELDGLSLANACATLESFTAKTIVDSLDLLYLQASNIPKHWILAGGGWYNPVIRRELGRFIQEKLGDGIVVETATEAGWNSDAMEAQLFAYFALRSLKNLPLSMPGTTGVPIPLSGGHIHLAPNGATAAVAALLA
jgi:anhydro-N-acetylmuramic acid kinase